MYQLQLSVRLHNLGHWTFAYTTSIAAGNRARQSVQATKDRCWQKIGCARSRDSRKTTKSQKNASHGQASRRG